MRVSEDIITEINSSLGSSGRPHHISSQGEPAETCCIEWLLPIGSEGVDSFIARDIELRTRLKQLLEDSKLDTELERLVSEQNGIRYAGFASQVTKLLRGSELYDELEEVILQIEELFAPFPQTIVHGTRVVEWRDIVPDGPRVGMAQAFWKVRELVQDDPVTVYRGISSWISYDMAIADRLIVAPITDQFEILRIEQIVANNVGLETNDVIRMLKELDDSIGIDIVGAVSDCVEFLLKRIPGENEAIALGKWLLDFCPDLWEAPTSFQKGRVALWWD